MKYLNYLLPIFFLFSFSVSAQELDWLKNSTSNNIFSTHSFYTSTQYNDDFYFAGDFWKDLTIDGENITIGGEIGNGFIVKMDESGVAEGLWPLISNNYVRINALAVNPISGSLIATGYYRENLVYNNEEWISDFFSNGIVMSIKSDGTLDWIKELKAQSEVSSASGEALAIDDEGNIFLGIEAVGEVDIEDQSFFFDSETAGVIITKLNVNGDLLLSDQWNSTIFEGGIDVIELELDIDNNLIIGGCVFGPMEIADSIYVFSTASNQNYIIKQNNDLNVLWLKTYQSNRSHVLDIEIDESDLLLSIQYNNSINIDGKIMEGTGSWGETVVVSVDENADLNWVKNFTLTENSGIAGVYGTSILTWNNQYYIAGMYQGDVVHNGAVIFDNTGSGGVYMFPFILSLNKVGDLTSTYDFVGSNEPGRISSISSNESHLIFGGDFSGQITIGDTSVNTINSALFYGALTNSVTENIEVKGINNLFNIYPTTTSDYLNVDTELTFDFISLISPTGVLLKKLHGRTKLINVKDLPSGMYYLAANINENVTMVHFIKQ